MLLIFSSGGLTVSFESGRQDTHISLPYRKNAVTVKHENMCTYNFTMWPIVVLICFTILFLLHFKRYTSLWTLVSDSIFLDSRRPVATRPFIIPKNLCPLHPISPSLTWSSCFPCSSHCRGLQFVLELFGFAFFRHDDIN
jgi:hypothetical protein